MSSCHEALSIFNHLQYLYLYSKEMCECRVFKVCMCKLVQNVIVFSFVQNKISLITHVIVEIKMVQIYNYKFGDKTRATLWQLTIVNDHYH